MNDELEKCNPCVICGSKVSKYYAHDEDMFGTSYSAVQCSNKKCHITGKYSKSKTTAVKAWNKLTEIHNKRYPTKTYSDLLIASETSTKKRANTKKKTIIEIDTEFMENVRKANEAFITRIGTQSTNQ